MKDWQILITGGSAGIGLSLAQRLAAEGAAVHLTGRRESALREAAAQIGPAARVYIGDIGRDEDRRRLFAELNEATNGRLDGLAVNAARYDFRPLLEMEPEELDAIFRVNAVSAFHFLKLAHPLLLRGKGKSALFVSSTLGARPVAGVGAYAASKAALNSLVKSFAIELASDGIRVNAVLPGVVDTPIHDPRAETDPSRAEKMAQMGPMHPLGRVGRPEEVAEAAAFLLSGKSAWNTGSLFCVDGGISLV